MGLPWAPLRLVAVIASILVVLVLGLVVLPRCGVDQPADPDPFFRITPPVFVSLYPSPPTTPSPTTTHDPERGHPEL